MAGRSSRLFTASEVLALLDDQEQFEAELGEFVDLDGESEDEDEPEADGNRPDSSPVLLEAEVVTPDIQVIFDAHLLLFMRYLSPW